MASTALPSIRPWITEDAEKKAVPFLISRIIDQKGGFRNISEESLQEEIATGESQIEDASSLDEKTGEDERPRDEQVKAAKQEVMRFSQYVVELELRQCRLHCI